MERFLVLAACVLVTVVALVVLAYQLRRLWIERGLSDEQVEAMRPPIRMQATANYSHEPAKVWGMIRPAEAAVLLGQAQRAFHVPGTPIGVGEQQCFIDFDGRESIVEVISELEGRSASTMIVSPPNMPIESTYELRPTETGCTLVYGMEIRAGGRLTRKQRSTWDSEAQKFLKAIESVLNDQHPVDRTTPPS